MVDTIMITLFAGISIGVGVSVLYYNWMYAPMLGYMNATKELERLEDERRRR